MLSARYINISTGRVGEAFPICEECFENVRENPFQLPTLEIYKLGVHEDAGVYGNIMGHDQNRILMRRTLLNQKR